MKFCTLCAMVLLLSVSPGAAPDEYRVLTPEEALSGVDPVCPEHIISNQVLMDVVHWGFDGGLHRGQLVVDARLVEDMQLVFAQMLILGFPLESVIPISELGWSDSLSMAINNTSGFNYREVAGSGNLSKHAYGMAVDFNPFLNPYCHDGIVSPAGSVYDPDAPGTLYAGHPVVELLKSLGWRWGGDWVSPDYQHFDRRLEDIELTVEDHHLPCFIWRFL